MVQKEWGQRDRDGLQWVREKQREGLWMEKYLIRGYFSSSDTEFIFNF